MSLSTYLLARSLLARRRGPYQKPVSSDAPSLAPRRLAPEVPEPVEEPVIAAIEESEVDKMEESSQPEVEVEEDTPPPPERAPVEGTPRMSDISQSRSLIGHANVAIIEDALKTEVITVLGKLLRAVKSNRVKPVEMRHMVHSMQYHGDLYPSGEVTSLFRFVGPPGMLSVYRSD
jgi:hypothetical protein